MSEAILFEVQGSAADPYRVTFEKRSNNKLSAYCTCPAGKNGQYCKHRFNILDGSTKEVVSTNTAEVLVVQSWLAGTDVEKCLSKMRALEMEAERVNKALSDAKKELSRSMLG